MAPRSRQHPDVPDAELEVLKALWQYGESTVRALRDAVYPGGGASAHATVQKLLDRLRRRGCVERRPDGHGRVWFATVDRDTLIRGRLQDTADRLCGGAVLPLLTELIRAHRWSDADAATIRALLARPEDAS